MDDELFSEILPPLRAFLTYDDLLVLRGVCNHMPITFNRIESLVGDLAMMDTTWAIKKGSVILTKYLSQRRCAITICERDAIRVIVRNKYYELFNYFFNTPMRAKLKLLTAILAKSPEDYSEFIEWFCRERPDIKSDLARILAHDGIVEKFANANTGRRIVLEFKELHLSRVLTLIAADDALLRNTFDLLNSEDIQTVAYEAITRCESISIIQFLIEKSIGGDFPQLKPQDVNENFRPECLNYILRNVCTTRGREKFLHSCGNCEGIDINVIAHLVENDYDVNFDAILRNWCNFQFHGTLPTKFLPAILEQCSDQGFLQSLNSSNSYPDGLTATIPLLLKYNAPVREIINVFAKYMRSQPN
jgi:hypothetical protein